MFSNKGKIRESPIWALIALQLLAIWLHTTPVESTMDTSIAAKARKWQSVSRDASRGSDELSVASWQPTVALSTHSDALDSLTGGDLITAAGEKKYMLVKKKPKHKKIKMEVYEPKMKYKKIKMKVPVKVMKKKKVKGYMVKKEHHYHH